MNARILVLDDEQRMVDIISMVLRREGYSVDTRPHPGQAIEALEAEAYDLLLTDLKMPDMDGVELLRRAREIQPELPIILITAHGSVPTAIEAMRVGAFDYVEKPFDNTELKTLVARALEVTRLSRENRYLRSELTSRHSLESIVAESQAMRDVLDRVRRAARSPSTVLVTGESGTGKELTARAVHDHNDPVASPFVAVNCKLLRVLQEWTMVRVGGGTERSVDVRIVAATNRDLRAEVDAGRCREDLYFRLAVIPLHLPPLRERREDVLPLARHFLARGCERLERSLDGWTPEVERRLETHTWPGNTRELENAVERGVVLDEAPREVPESTGLRFLDQAARERIQAALREAGGKRIEATCSGSIERPSTA